jgi:hypothetical protein
MRVGALAGAGAMLAMAVPALLGVLLLGLDPETTWVVLALAVGGSASVSPSAGVPASLELHVMPLGVSVVGAVTLLLVVLLVRREDPRTLAVRAGVAAGTFLALVAVVVLVQDLGVDGVQTVFGAVVWLLVVAGIGFLCQVRAIRSMFFVLLTVMGATLVAGLVAAIWGGAKVVGTVLLGGPNLVLIAFTRGLGVPWSVGPASGRLPVRIDAGGLDALTADLWPLSVFAALVLMVCVVLAARDRVGGPFAGLVVAVLVPAGVALAGASVRIRLGPFGMELGALGKVFPALGVGLAAGAVTTLFVLAARTWQGRRV